MARCLVVYDIENDRVRTKVAGICLNYGLQRIQLSAFLGTLSRAHQDELLQRARRQVGQTTGHVVVFPLSDVDFQSRREVSVA